ncbi:MAG: sigma 54-interacting transcriptional regulator [Candidatus Methylomirabilis sp.]|nr:sigma 54-interacting transcriptional regulator [Candidatus Methylomirabilis sp.]
MRYSATRKGPSPARPNGGWDAFELADGGTIFLDEVAEMKVATQAKFLRILQEGTFRRLSGSKEIHVDVRVVAATNKNPAQAVEDGLIREDLYYRLNVFNIYLPPLRERPEDIPSLFERSLRSSTTNTIKRSGAWMPGRSPS